MSDSPISDYGLLSDIHTAALVNRSGSIDWLPFPRFDSPSVFARILDRQGGHFSICPEAIVGVERKYLQGTMSLETTF